MREIKSSFCYFILTMMFFVYTSCKQVAKDACEGLRNCPKHIFIDKYEGIGEYNLVWDTTISDDREKFIVKQICDCDGKMRLWEYTISDSTLLFEGSYVNGRDSTITFYWANFEEPFNDIPDTMTYSIPLRDGVWKYYDKSGVLVKTENYQKGVLK